MTEAGDGELAVADSHRVCVDAAAAGLAGPAHDVVAHQALNLAALRVALLTEVDFDIRVDTWFREQNAFVVRLDSCRECISLILTLLKNIMCQVCVSHFEV